MRFKEIIACIAIFAFSIMLIFGAVKIARKASFDLKEVTKAKGAVLSLRETMRRTGGKTRVARVVAFNISSVVQTLGVAGGVYTNEGFARYLKLGDTVVVYYKQGQINDINLNVYQVEKGDQVIFSAKAYKKRHIKVTLPY